MASSPDNKKFFVHELARCESRNIGDGTRVWAFSHVMEGATIGRGCNLGEHVFVENKVTIGDGCTIKNGVAVWDCVTLGNNVFVGPYAVFTNDFRPRAFLKRRGTHFLPTRVGEGATIGANATIVCGITIGEYAMIGAGAVVIEDVPPFSLVAGNPARLIGRVCYCGGRLNEESYCKACQRKLSENSVAHAIETLSVK